MLNSQRYDVKVVPEPRGPGFWDPGTHDELPQSLKAGPGTTLKFKRGTPGPPSKFKSETPGSPAKFKSGTPSPSFNELCFFKKVGPPHLSLMNSLFSKLFLRFFYLFIFVSFLNKMPKKYQL